MVYRRNLFGRAPTAACYLFATLFSLAAGCSESDLAPDAGAEASSEAAPDTATPPDSAAPDGQPVDIGAETFVDSKPDSDDVGDDAPRDTLGDLLDVEQDISADAAEDVAKDAAEDVAADAEPDIDADPCASYCATGRLEAVDGARVYAFDRAYFGLDVPAVPGDSVKLYIEAYRGGAEGCPKEDSPTPKQTLIISGWSLGAAEASLSDGLRAVLLDFAGDIVDSPVPMRATSATIKRVAVCEPCAPWPTREQRDTTIFAELDAKLSLEGKTITVKGMVVASHCNSLD